MSAHARPALAPAAGPTAPAAAAAHAGVRVNLGSGAVCPPGWVSIDNSPGARMGRFPRLLRTLHATLPGRLRGVLPARDWPAGCVVMDLTRPLRLPTGSVRYAYSSHLLEHLGRDEGAALLREVFRVLEPGGVVRTLVPDLAAIVDAYVRDRAADPEHAAERLHANTYFFEMPAPRRWRDVPVWYVRSRHNHRFLYDEPALRSALESAGFTDVRRRGFGESDIPGILEVETPDRFESAFCLEARRPNGP